MNEDKYTHKAFISYSQDPDKEIAKKLEDKIERFGIGWHRLKKQKLFIFRDVTDLVPDKNLPEKIEDALSKSEFLIVLAQKKFSQNDFSWVNVEAEYFVKSCEKRGDDPIDRIILVVTDGEIAWDRNKNQWDYNITNVIPKSLQQIFKHEPLYVDLRLLNEKSALNSQKKKVFNDALIAIVAKLLYKKPSEIQNQIIKLQRYVIGFIALILVFISILSVYAKIQKDYAVENAEEAIKQEKIAVKNAEEAKRQETIAKENEEEAKKQEEIAVENAEEARKQELIAKDNAEEARRQEQIAKDNAEEARRQEQVAKDNAEEARRQENIAKTEKARTDTINKLIAAENLALKSLDFFKSLDDSVVSNISLDIDSLAVSQRDSINKALGLFKEYGGITKDEHKNKLEALYTSDVMSDVFFSSSNIKLDSLLYDIVYQTPENKTIAANLQGQIYDVDRRQIYNVDTTLTKGNNIYQFIEVTPVVGTNLLVYSNYEKNINLFDIKEKILRQVEFKNISDSTIFVSAFSENGKDLMLKSKKDSIYQIPFPEENKSDFIASIHKDTSDIELFRGELKSKNTTYTNASFYCITGDSSRFFWGNTNGEVIEHNRSQKKKDHTIASLKDRINKILYDKDSQILIVQVGANQLVLFVRLDQEFIKIYQKSLGNRIIDIYLGKNGHLYVLYDRNRLVSWPVQNELFKRQKKKLAKR